MQGPTHNEQQVRNVFQIRKSAVMEDPVEFPVKKRGKKKIRN